MQTTQTKQPCNVTAIQAEYLDCCLSDYFQGYSGEEVLAVPVWAGITYSEAYSEAKQTFHEQSGYFDDVPDAGNMGDNAIYALFASMLIDNPDKLADFAQYIEKTDDDCVPDIYLYIGLRAEFDNE